MDEDKSHNSIDNFECLTHAEHARRHPFSDERREWQIKHLNRIRPLTKAWHSSEEGLAKHREIGGLAYASFVPVAKSCDQCGQTFLPRKIGNMDRFCSNACKSAYRRASGADDETRICEECGGGYTVNRYSKARTCSRACANRLSWRESR